MDKYQEFIIKAREKFGDKFEYKQETYVNHHTKMEIICPEHGVFMQRPSDHKKSKYGCPKCYFKSSSQFKKIQPHQRVGQIFTNNSGYKMKCVNYNGYHDVEVEFLCDGTRVKTTMYYLTSGKTNHPKFRNKRKADVSKYIGQESYNNLGLHMVVISARRANDIDVKFDDGTVVKSSWGVFKKGEIANPNYTKTMLQRQERLGMILEMRNGLKCEIVEYIDSAHVKVRFTDGFEKWTQFTVFKNQLVGHPNIHDSKLVKNRRERNGLERTLSDGTTYKIVDYIDAQNVSVLINNDKIEHMTFKQFNQRSYYDETERKKQQIIDLEKNWSSKRAERIGEIRKNKYTGEEMELLEWRGDVGYRRVIVKFSDGTVVETSLQNFTNGATQNPNRPNRCFVSLPEFSITQHLKKHGFSHFGKGTMKEYGLGRLEIDCFNPKMRVGIEFDGWWHNFYKDVKKNELCKKNNIDLYRIRVSSLPTLPNFSNSYVLTDDKTLSDNFIQTVDKMISDINCKYKTSIPPFKINVDQVKKDYFNYTYSINNVIGNTKQLANGDVLTIVAYRGYMDLDVCCNNGEIFTTSMQSFEHGKFLKDKKYLRASLKGQQKNIKGTLWTIQEYENCKIIHIVSSTGQQEIISLNEWRRGVLKKIKINNKSA